MNQPPFEVADIVRAAGKSFIEKNRSRLSWQQLRVLRAIERCRTAALGGHVDQCFRCGYQAISYNSVVTAIAPSVRPTLVTSGSLPAKRNCWRCVTCMSSSRCRIGFPLSRFQTRKSSMTFCSAPAQQHYWRLRPIPSTSVLTSVVGVYCIPGVRTSSRTLIHNAWRYHLVDFQ
jgi:hypothetical protein